jgi:hypothetical protein
MDFNGSRETVSETMIGRRKHRIYRRTTPRRSVPKKPKIPGLRENYYIPHIEQSTWICEECGDRIPNGFEWQRFTAQCHILPKEVFGEVALEMENHFHGCLRCHNSFDSGPAAVVKKMKILPVLRERLLTFIHKIKPEKLRLIPKYLIEITD